MTEEEFRKDYDAAVQAERAAWEAFSTAVDTDKSYAVLKLRWRDAAKRVADLAHEMEQRSSGWQDL